MLPQKCHFPKRRPTGALAALKNMRAHPQVAAHPVHLAIGLSRVFSLVSTATLLPNLSWARLFLPHFKQKRGAETTGHFLLSLGSRWQVSVANAPPDTRDGLQRGFVYASIGCFLARLILLLILLLSSVIVIIITTHWMEIKQLVSIVNGYESWPSVGHNNARKRCFFVASVAKNKTGNG